ncbi:MAG: hypothetical protein V5A76_08005 [Candidatus Thermoplasmatota archaeon]
MIDDLILALVYFLIALVISSIIILVVTKVFGEKEGIGTAIIAALAGAIIYALASFFLGGGIIASILAGIVWTIAIASLYKMSWLKAIITAVVVWIVAFVIESFLPTLMRPL